MRYLPAGGLRFLLSSNRCPTSLSNAGTQLHRQSHRRSVELNYRQHPYEERENAVFEELLYGVRSVAVQTGDVLNYLEKLGVQLRSRRDAERFTALYSAFHNTTRMSCNRGYTPDEMVQMTPPEERFKSLSLGPNIRKSLQTGEMDIEDFRKQILTMELPSEAMRFDLLKQLAEIKPSTPQPGKQKKVGRNDPCPCGSGKKYKRCCGK